MQSLDLEAVSTVRVALQEMISARKHGVQVVPYFAPTNIGVLSHDAQEKEASLKEETDYGNRVRASIHMTLSAAVASLEVAEALMKDFDTADAKERNQELIRCSLNARVARDAAAEAAAVLSGQQAPKSDGMVEIKRLRTALFRRFGIGE